MSPELFKALQAWTQGVEDLLDHQGDSMVPEQIEQIERIARDCGLSLFPTDVLRIALQTNTAQNPIHAVKDEVIGALYRRIENLELDKAGLTMCRLALEKLTRYIKVARAGDSPLIHKHVIEWIDESIVQAETALAATEPKQ